MSRLQKNLNEQGKLAITTFFGLKYRDCRLNVTSRQIKKPGPRNSSSPDIIQQPIHNARPRSARLSNIPNHPSRAEVTGEPASNHPSHLFPIPPYFQTIRAIEEPPRPVQCRSSFSHTRLIFLSSISSLHPPELITPASGPPAPLRVQAPHPSHPSHPRHPLHPLPAAPRRIRSFQHTASASTPTPYGPSGGPRR